MSMNLSITLLLLYALFPASTTHGFSRPPSTLSKHVIVMRAPRSLRVVPQKEEVDALRHEIDDMRQEALRRMEALQVQLSESKNSTVLCEASEKVVVEEEEDEEDDEADEIVFTPRIAVSNAQTVTKKVSAPTTTPTRRKSLADQERENMALLDGTRWKVMLNIGREPGTWMPKTWGVSGDRILLNLEVEFTSEQLYEREEFLNGMAGAKILNVVNQHLTLAPSMTEGSRIIPVKHTGGWRVAPGEGPMGTDLLRFFIEVEEDVRHQGGDVSCPAGRVYCTCGYFPTRSSSGLKDRMREEQESLGRRYDQLTDDMETADFWSKLKIAKELLDIRIEVGKVTQRMNELRVREPERSLLRQSRKQDVGLTKEGGVCCKVTKGMAVEYHILGKFGVASIDIREKHEEAEDDGGSRSRSE